MKPFASWFVLPDYGILEGLFVVEKYQVKLSDDVQVPSSGVLSTVIVLVVVGAD